MRMNVAVMGIHVVKLSRRTTGVPEQRRLASQSQPKVRLSRRSSPEQGQSHQQRHDQDQHFQETAADDMGIIVPVQSNLRCNSRGIAQHWWLMKTSGIRTVEGGGTRPSIRGPQSTRCHREIRFRQPESCGKTAVCGHMMVRELAELPESLAVDEHLISVIEGIRHLQREGSLSRRLRQFEVCTRRSRNIPYAHEPSSPAPDRFASASDPCPPNRNHRSPGAPRQDHPQYGTSRGQPTPQPNRQASLRRCRPLVRHWHPDLRCRLQMLNEQKTATRLIKASEPEASALSQGKTFRD